MGRTIDVTVKHNEAQTEKPDPVSAEDSKKNNRKKRTAFRSKLTLQNIFFAVSMIAALGSAGYFWNDARTSKQQTLAATESRKQEETQTVIDSLSRVLLIRSEEKPTVARVENPDVLRNSDTEFYKDVQAGDYLVLYPERAIIYRLSESKLINIAPIVNPEATAQ